MSASTFLFMFFFFYNSINFRNINRLQQFRAIITGVKCVRVCIRQMLLVVFFWLCVFFFCYKNYDLWLWLYYGLESNTHFTDLWRLSIKTKHGWHDKERRIDGQRQGESTKRAEKIDYLKSAVCIYLICAFNITCKQN